MKKIPLNRKDIDANDQIDFIGDPKDAVLVQRFFQGKTARDLAIEAQPIPRNPFWLHLVVRMIRSYQHYLSPKLGNRCVFDPSCSRYAEVAFRKKGLLKGAVLTISRLWRCRAKNGGVDEVV